MARIARFKKVEGASIIISSMWLPRQSEYFFITKKKYNGSQAAAADKTYVDKLEPTKPVSVYPTTKEFE